MVLDFSEIIPARLLVGAYVREEDVRRLEKLGITSVVSLQTDDDLQFYGVSLLELAALYRDADIEFRRVPTPDFDREALQRNLPAAVSQVESAMADPRARLYLHCTAGVNRSPTTAAGYLIKSRGIPARESYEYLVSRRDCSPTLDILMGFEASLRARP